MFVFIVPYFKLLSRTTEYIIVLRQNFVTQNFARAYINVVCRHCVRNLDRVITQPFSLVLSHSEKRDRQVYEPGILNVCRHILQQHKMYADVKENNFKMLLHHLCIYCICCQIFHLNIAQFAGESLQLHQFQCAHEQKAINLSGKRDQRRMLSSSLCVLSPPRHGLVPGA